jgi:oligogalacturonide lyase
MRTNYLLLFCIACTVAASAQPVLETRDTAMPKTWIDKDTRHKVVRLSNIPGNSLSFYFHNNPFIGNKMVFYNASNARGAQESEKLRAPVTAGNPFNRQIFLLDLETQKAEQLTNHANAMNGEIVAPKSGNIYYQIKDSVFVVNAFTKISKLVFVFPEGYKGSIATVNADETLLAGAKASDEQKEILKKYPAKSEFFQRIFDAHLPNDLFKVETKTATLSKIHTENTWLGHVQFSPTEPNLLMFCHEGPWHKLDRIWTIDVQTKEVKLMHKRTMDMEIAGHEWPSIDGNTIWFDLQMPKGNTFFVAGTDVHTGKEIKYELQRDEWSIHFNVSNDGKLFCGDGGDSGQVAKAKDGQWIYLFRPDGDKMKAERLVNMKFHNYKLEPNVHFSPDGNWVIFRANFERWDQVYAVEVKRS